MTKRTPERRCFDQEFYAPGSLQKAAADFHEYLSVSVEEVGRQIAVDATVKERYVDATSTILSEFGNYVLDLSLQAYFGSHARENGP